MAVAVVAVAVSGAGAPAIVLASGDLTESQGLVSLSELNGRAVVLGHSLADERDAMTEYVAAGRKAASGDAGGVPESLRARVDRQVSEIHDDAPAALRRALGSLPAIRKEALAGRGSALDTYTAYTEVVQALQDVSHDLARRIPPRASDGPAEALPTLGRAAERASGTRALLLAALSAESGSSRLVAAAQQARVQEQAALADFDRTAPESATERYANTVNGTEAGTAERYLARLTDQPQFDSKDLALGKDRVGPVLSGRIDRMRAVDSALTTAESARLAKLRDDDVTALEMRIGLVALCLLIAAGTATSVARSMTRPLAVLRIGSRRVAADPVTQEPVRFTGRNDEFAEVVRAVNELRETAVRLHTRADHLGEDRTLVVAERQRLADEREELRRAQDDLTERLAGLQDRVHGTYVNLALRILGLVERQLAVIEGMEDGEQDPERLDTLYKLDHLATGMRRHSENLLVLAGAEHGTGHAGAVPMLDVLRASISEIERYERVRINQLPPHSQVAGFAADAVSHLVAELLENATSYSPPEADVQLSGWLLESGEVMLSVQDEGIGVSAERLEALNARLADPHGSGADDEEEDSQGLGLYVVARLAARHGVRVQLRDQKQGGVTAVVVLPKSILPTRPSPVGTGSSASSAPAPSVTLPGTVAEANANALPRRGSGRAPAVPSAGAQPVSLALTGDDPMVAAAERAVAEAESGADEPGRATDPGHGGGAENRPDRPEAGDPLYGMDSGYGATAPGRQDILPAGTSVAASDPYAIGPDEHGRAEDSRRSDGVDQETQELRLPFAGIEQLQEGHSTDGAADSGTGTGPAQGRPRAAGPSVPGSPAAGEAWSADVPEPRTDGAQPITDKGLPKRTPKLVKQTAPEKEQKRSVDAEALRRRLGGFYQGSREGRRDAEAEITEQTGEHRTGALDEGGTVEEARG